jgi:hypothetical protein
MPPISIEKPWLALEARHFRAVHNRCLFSLHQRLHDLFQQVAFELLLQAFVDVLVQPEYAPLLSRFNVWYLLLLLERITARG